VTGPEVVRRYLDALNRRDLPAMLQLLDPEVEFVTGRGLRHGHDEVRKWLGEPYAELEVERAVDRVQAAGPVVVAVGRIRHRWRDSGEVADETGFAWLFEVHEDRITRWQKFGDEAAALAAAGLPTKTTS
jgi:ketosteroid isomerase-like protein